MSQGFKHGEWQMEEQDLKDDLCFQEGVKHAETHKREFRSF